MKRSFGQTRGVGLHLSFSLLFHYLRPILVLKMLSMLSWSLGVLSPGGFLAKVVIPPTLTV